VVTERELEAGDVFITSLRAAIELHDVLRAKGFVDRPWDSGERRETRPVAIGKKGLDRKAITSALAVAVA
jgi:hypothetical protein